MSRCSRLVLDFQIIKLDYKKNIFYHNNIPKRNYITFKNRNVNNALTEARWKLKSVNFEQVTESFNL